MQPSLRSRSRLSNRLILAERLLRRDAARRGGIERAHREILAGRRIPFGDGLAQGLAVHGGHLAVDEPGAIELGQNAEHAARPVHVLDVVLGSRWRDLAQAGHLARDLVDVGHGELHLGLLRAGKQVEDRVGRSAHGHVERHGVLEGLEGGDRTRQRRGVVLFVVALGKLDGDAARAQEQRLAIGVRSDQGAVAGQRQAQSLGEAVHGIGGEHARARAAGGASRAFVFRYVGVGYCRVARLDHGVDEIHVDLFAAIFAGLARQLDLACFHGATRHEHGRDVQAQGRHQHAGCDLVAVGNAHHGIGAVGVDHVLDAVRDELARWQRVEHAVVAHGDAVVDGDGVEFFGHAARGLDFACDHLPQVFEVHVAGHELGEAVDHGNDGLAEVSVLHAGGAPEGACASHVATKCGCA